MGVISCICYIVIFRNYANAFLFLVFLSFGKTSTTNFTIWVRCFCHAFFMAIVFRNQILLLHQCLFLPKVWLLFDRKKYFRPERNSKSYPIRSYLILWRYFPQMDSLELLWNYLLFQHKTRWYFIKFYKNRFHGICFH